MKKQSQKLWVKNRLNEEGVIDNLSCIQRGIWRLSDVILHLRREGMAIDMEYNTPKVGKNTHYYLKNWVKPPVIVGEIVEVNGERMYRRREVLPETQTLI